MYRASAYRSGGLKFFKLKSHHAYFYLLVVVTNELALTLLVTKILADHHYATLTTNDFALVANLLHAWINLHVFFLLCKRTIYL
jgi:hypothetical protein